MINKNSEFPELSSQLEELFTYKNWSALWQTYTLTRNWPKIVGKNVAKKSEPAYIQKNTLWVYVQSSVLMQHMQPQKLSLLKKVKEMIPDAGIQDIRWAMQPAKPAAEKKQQITKKVTAPDPEEKQAFESMVSTVEDEKCRKALTKLWKTYHNN